jgi:hypothetical protein
MKRSLTLALLFGATATIGFCLAVWSWNLAFESAASWRIPLNVFSFPGLLASALAFPCKSPDVQIGCEWYRTFPVFIVVNSLVCTATSLPVIHLFRSLRRRK